MGKQGKQPAINAFSFLFLEHSRLYTKSSGLFLVIISIREIPAFICYHLEATMPSCSPPEV